MEDCPICFADVASINTSCNHHFCEKCFQQWTNLGKRTCPLCRARIQPLTATIEPKVGQRIKLKHKSFPWLLEGLFIRNNEGGSYVLAKEGRTYYSFGAELELGHISIFDKYFWEVQ